MALEKVAAALESAGASVVRDSREFEGPVCGLRHRLSPNMMGFCHGDLQWYLDQHPDRPEPLRTADQVQQKMDGMPGVFYAAPDDPAVVTALCESLDADAGAQEAAYAAWLHAVGASALLVPAVAGSGDQFLGAFSSEGWTKDEKPESSSMPMVAHFTKHLNSIRIPSIVIPVPSVLRKQAGCETMPSAVMLLGKPHGDRQLLAIALAVEQVMASHMEKL